LDGDEAYAISRGILSTRRTDVVYKSLGPAADPLDHREDANLPRLPLDSRARFYLERNRIEPTGTTRFADFEKTEMPFGFDLRFRQTKAASVWLAEPSVGDYGVSVLYLGPLAEGDGRMNGVVVHLVITGASPPDPASMEERLREVLSGIGIGDPDALLQAPPLSLPPVKGVTEQTSRGNFTVARHYTSDGALGWYSVGVFRRVFLPNE
jgi:hypothetical protein